MSGQTVGAFLKEKLTNMATWIEEELGTSDVDLKQYLAGRTETEIAYVVGNLCANSIQITHRDWSGLARLYDLPKDLLMLIDAIRKREDMHDKFWRYLELFSDAVSSDA